MRRPLRIGIYAGTFNPVHAGHIGFALQTIKEAKLDYVYFMPERRPRHKEHVEHYAHRVAMLKSAAKPHSKLKVLETDDVSFTVKRTLPRLESRFKHSQIVFLVGSDVAAHLHTWAGAEQLLKRSEIAIGVRQDTSEEAIHLLPLMIQPSRAIFVVKSCAPDVSSHKIREALRHRHYVRGLLTSVARYSNRNWLYISLAQPQ